MMKCLFKIYCAIASFMNSHWCAGAAINVTHFFHPRIDFSSNQSVTKQNSYKIVHCYFPDREEEYD